MSATTKKVNWAGFNGTDADLDRWRRSVKLWSRRFASRVRRSDLAEDIESAVIVFFGCQGHMGWECRKELERFVRNACSLGDDRKLARDSDLTARANEQRDHGYVASFLEERVQDPHGEDDLVAALDGEPREEGRDQDELLEEIDQAAAGLSVEQEQVLSLQHLWGYSIRETARYQRCSTATVSTRRKQARIRRESRTLRAKADADPTFTQVEVSWIRL